MINMAVLHHCYTIAISTCTGIANMFQAACGMSGPRADVHRLTVSSHLLAKKFSLAAKLLNFVRAYMHIYIYIYIYT